MIALGLEQALQFLDSFISTNLANFVLLIGVIISAVTFLKTFGKMRRSEQLKMAHDIQLMLSNAHLNYDKVILQLDSIFPHDKEKRTALHRTAFMEILNTIEWISFLILRKEIDNELIEYFKPLVIQYHDNCEQLFPSLLKDENEYKELKALYAELNGQKDGDKK
jgi:hypothetical protein